MRHSQAHAVASGAGASSLTATSVSASAGLAGQDAPAPVSASTRLLQKYVCAASAAGIAETLTMPLDVAKTRMQLSGEGQTGKANRGLLSMFAKIYRADGAKGLYLGLTPAVLRQALVGGIGVGLYPQIKDLFVHVSRDEQGIKHALQSYRAAPFPSTSDPAAPLSFGTKVLAGATSGVIGQLIAAPTCVVKVRLQADARLSTPRYMGTWHAFRTIPAQEGWRALFRGIVPSLQRAAFMYGATISTYDEVKHALVARLYGGDAAYMDRVSTHVMASSVSGLVASLVSAPFDTLKTRIINQPVQPRKPILGVMPNNLLGAGPGAPPGVVMPASLYSSTFDCVVKTVRNEGVRALYKGFVPCYARLAPWQLSFFVVYEQISLAVTGESLR